MGGWHVRWRRITAVPAPPRRGSHSGRILQNRAAGSRPERSERPRRRVAAYTRAAVPGRTIRVAVRRGAGADAVSDRAAPLPAGHRDDTRTAGDGGRAAAGMGEP